MINVGVLYNLTTVDVWMISFVLTVFVIYFVVIKRTLMELNWKHWLLLIVSCAVVAYIVMLLLMHAFMMEK